MELKGLVARNGGVLVILLRPGSVATVFREAALQVVCSKSAPFLWYSGTSYITGYT